MCNSAVPQLCQEFTLLGLLFLALFDHFERKGQRLIGWSFRIEFLEDVFRRRGYNFDDEVEDGILELLLGWFCLYIGLRIGLGCDRSLQFELFGERRV